METNCKTDTETANKVMIDLLTEIFVNQQIILDRLARFDAMTTKYTKDEMMEFYSRAREGAKEMVADKLFEKFGPDLAAELSL